MGITPLISQGYDGPIRRLKCSSCQHIFYITQADYEKLREVLYCYEWSIILHAEIKKMQPTLPPVEQSQSSVRHPRTIDREKMTAEQMIEEGKKTHQQWEKHLWHLSNQAFDCQTDAQNAWEKAFKGKPS